MSTHEIFISYAKADEQYHKQLETHLSVLKEQGLISLWHDGQIEPGTNTAATIDIYLSKAQVILLLVSADFLASDSCVYQMKQALKHHQAGVAKVIPIVVHPCDWVHLPVGKLQALPRAGHPVSLWANVHEAWVQVAVGLRQMIENVPPSGTKEVTLGGDQNAMLADKDMSLQKQEESGDIRKTRAENEKRNSTSGDLLDQLIQNTGGFRMNIYGGSTPKGSTGWIHYSSDGIYVDIDTSAANFKKTPLYYTSLEGDSRHWMAQGGNSIYMATPNKFRVYIYYSDITPGQANGWNWRVNWLGIEF